MTKQKLSIISLLIVCLASFSVLLSIGSDIYREAPPIPTQVVNTSGDVIFTENDIQRGQLVWRSMGGHQLGSIWGHGSYVAPDWTADWLHREANNWLELKARDEFNKPFTQLSNSQQAALEQQLRDDLRPNNYNVENGVITISQLRSDAISMLQQHYIGLFGDDPAYQPLRKDYAMKEGTVSTAERREQLTAFFFWSAWAATTERVDQNYTYTNNWPYDPMVGNTPTSSNIVWSILSVVVLIAGVGALAWYHATLKHEPLPTPPKYDPLFDSKPTDSQKAVGKYFFTAVGLFLLQVFLGGNYCPLWCRRTGFLWHPTIGSSPVFGNPYLAHPASCILDRNCMVGGPDCILRRRYPVMSLSSSVWVSMCFGLRWLLSYSARWRENGWPFSSTSILIPATCLVIRVRNTLI